MSSVLFVTKPGLLLRYGQTLSSQMISICTANLSPIISVLCAKANAKRGHTSVYGLRLVTNLKFVHSLLIKVGDCRLLGPISLFRLHFPRTNFGQSLGDADYLGPA